MHEAGMRKRWRRRSTTGQGIPAKGPTPPGEPVRNLAMELGISPLVADLLSQRGLVEAKTARQFLDPQLTDLHDPALMPGLDRAAHRLAQAVRESQPIVIYGDYDVDGVCASAILWHVLRAAGATVSTYVPHRIDEGYGLNTRALCKLAGIRAPSPAGEESYEDISPAASDKPPLIVSVDCGITAMEPARIMREQGIDLIITDHHAFNPQQLPEAAVLVHPRLARSGEPAYPFPDLCGAGVAFKLAWHFARVWNGSDRVPSNYKVLLLDLLSLAALGTVADIVPLLGENRIITMFGLGQIKRTQFTGLNALIDASRLRDEKIDAYHVGFVLGPRLNACGRMGHAREAVQLLTWANAQEAAGIAQFLCQQNDARRATEKAMFNEARSMVEELGYHLPQQRAIVLGKQGWHAGVVGIVASRLVEAFHRPVVMLSVHEGEAHGSARSVPGVSMHEALSHCAAHLSTFGGHAMAAGLRLEVSRMEIFRRSLVEFINARLPADALASWLDWDADCTLADITFDLAQDVQMLAPFGAGNPAPLFCLRQVALAGPVRRMGMGGKHLRLLLRGQGRHVEAVWFNAGDLEEQLQPGALLDVVFRPVIATWQGRRRLEIHVQDVRVRAGS